jgi:hypothetical protein
MRVGLQFGKTFIGIDSTKGGAIIPPFHHDDWPGSEREVVAGSIEGIMELLRGTYTDTNLITLFHSIPEIYSPINEIASRAMTARYILKDLKTDEPIYDNEEWNRLMETPNPFQNFGELMYEAICYEIVTGKEYMLFNQPKTMQRFDYKNITSIYNLPSNLVTPETDEYIKLWSATEMSDIIKKFVLLKGTEQEQEFKTERVMYRRMTNLSWDGRKIEGKSPLLAAEKAIKNLIAVYEARGVIYLRRGSLGMWVSRKKDDSGMIPLTMSEKKNAAKDMNENFGVVGKNKMPFGITSAPIDFVKSTMTIAEMQPFEETHADAAAIYGVLRVPYELAPKRDRVTIGSQQTAERSVYHNVVIPLVRSYCQSVTNKLKLNAIGAYFDADFTQVDVLQENKKDKATVDNINTKTMYRQFLAGIRTLNDWRKYNDDEPSVNPLYDKLIYDMTPEELLKVQEICTLIDGAAADSRDRADNTQTNQDPGDQTD